MGSRDKDPFDPAESRRIHVSKSLYRYFPGYTQCVHYLSTLAPFYYLRYLCPTNRLQGLKKPQRSIYFYLTTSTYTRCHSDSISHSCVWDQRSRLMGCAGGLNSALCHHADFQLSRAVKVAEKSCQSSNWLLFQ